MTALHRYCLQGSFLNGFCALVKKLTPCNSPKQEYGNREEGWQEAQECAKITGPNATL
jgi:hypothetical protein